MKLFIGILLAIVILSVSSCLPARAPQPQPNNTAIPPAVSSTPSPAVVEGFFKHQVKDATQRQAVCNDGSPAVYYYHPGSGMDASHWLIFLQGGGWCGSDQSCTYRWSAQHYLMTSQESPAALSVSGIFSTSEQQNPDFAGFTQVYILYCSSDMYSGDGQRQVGSLNLQFRGHKIIAAILADLQDASIIPSPNLKNASQVLVGGSSAGSFGAASNLDWIASQLPWAKVKGVLDSSWVAPLNDYGNGPAGPQPGSSDFYKYFPAIADQSCAEANPSQPQICLSTLELYPYLSTPVFVYADQRDPTLLMTKGVADAHDPSVAPYITLYSASLRQSLQNVTAVLSPSAGIHTALANDGFYSIMVNGHNFAELLGNWYFSRPGPIRVIEGETP